MLNTAVYLDYENVTFTFFKLPQFLFTEPQFVKLSSDAKLVYSVMLNRLPLSIRNGWRDHGLFYIYFSMETVMELLHCSKSKALRVMGELRAFRLVEGYRCADHRRMRYVFLHAAGYSTEPVTTKATENDVDSHLCMTETGAVSNTGRVETGVISDTCTGVISEPETVTGVISEPDRSESETCTGVKTPSEQVSEPDRREINTNKTLFEQDHLNQEPPAPAPVQTQAPVVTQRRRWRWSKQELVKDLGLMWERDTMYQGADQAKLDRLIQTCASALSQRESFRINGAIVPFEAVHKRLMGLDCEEVGYALEYLNSPDCRCSSTAAYSIAVLYNAPDEAVAYWDGRVAQDLYGSSSGVA